MTCISNNNADLMTCVSDNNADTRMMKPVSQPVASRAFLGALYLNSFDPLLFYHLIFVYFFSIIMLYIIGDDLRLSETDSDSDSD